MKGSNRAMDKKCENCDEYSVGRADAEEGLEEKVEYFKNTLEELKK